MSIILIIFLSFISINAKYLNVNFVENGPAIDGVFDSIWLEADSSDEFFQFYPIESSIPSEKTIVYVLQDEHNIYFAFKCYTQNSKATAGLGAKEDNVTIAIDPIGSRNMAYYFTVNLSGQVNTGSDGWILDNGNYTDYSWDGVWYSSSKIYDDFYFTEVKIPFKSMKFKSNLDVWGVNFSRFINEENENINWIDFKKNDGKMITNYGKLINVKPKSKGLNIEVYPEGFVKYSKRRDENRKINLMGSLNAKWDITSQITFNTAIYPDFSQIESDPFNLNLSKYPSYLSEKRPFFIENSDIFRSPAIGINMGSNKMDIFYSRKIGKSMGFDAVPIIAGAKLTGKSEYYDYGFLGAVTDEYYSDTTLIERKKGFGVLRIKRKFQNSSHIGMLFNGYADDSLKYNYAGAIDGVLYLNNNRAMMQAALSDKNKKRGWALNGVYANFYKNLISAVSFFSVSDSFDVDDIGYVPYKGLSKISIISAYNNYVYGKHILNTTTGMGYIRIKKPQTAKWSDLGLIFYTMNFTNGFGLSTNLSGGPMYDRENKYFVKEFTISTWKTGKKYSMHLGSNLNYTYNYFRGYIAWINSSWFSYSINLIPRLSADASGNSWIEFKPDRSIENITLFAKPKMNFTISKDMLFSVFDEFVWDKNSKKIKINNIGFLYSWNFAPKSWFYIALNESRGINENSILEQSSFAGAFKIKYLMVF